MKNVILCLLFISVLCSIVSAKLVGTISSESDPWFNYNGVKIGIDNNGTIHAIDFCLNNGTICLSNGNFSGNGSGYILGTCPPGYAVQNVTLGGIECVSIQGMPSSAPEHDPLAMMNISGTYDAYSQYWINQTEGVCTPSNGLCASPDSAGGIVHMIISGSSLSGSDGSTSRQYYYNASWISLDNYILNPTLDYTQSVSGLITFSIPVWNEQKVSLWKNNINITSVQYTGSSFSGSDGLLNRQITVINPFMIAVDNFLMHENIDYSVSGSTINMLIPIYNEQVITIWHQ